MEKKEGTSSTNDGTDPPQAKKLRFSEQDLQLVVKYTDETGLEATKSYSVYSQVLAKYSKFIDTSLSVEMKEKKDRVIVFHDTTPEVFELALHLQESLTAARNATVDDLLKVASFYDKYEFTDGLDLCGAVFREYIKALVNDERRTDLVELPTNLDEAIDVISTSFALNLEPAIQSAKIFLQAKLKMLRQRNAIVLSYLLLII